MREKPGGGGGGPSEGPRRGLATRPGRGSDLRGAGAPGGEEWEAGHLAKRRRKTKGLEVGFDPEKHREFVSGFRKRKQKRREDAQAALKKREREEKAKQRADNRSKLRAQLRERGYNEYGERPGAAAASGEAAAAAPQLAETRVFEAADVRSVVTIEPLAMGASDSEQD